MASDLAASMLIAARDNGYGARDQDQIVLATVAQYRQAMREFADMDNLSVWYARLEIERLLEERSEARQPRALRRTRRALAKAPPTGGSCSSSTDWSTSPARWSAWGVSGPEPGSPCS